MSIHNSNAIAWLLGATALLLLKQTMGLTFSVNLSSTISQMYYGQLLTYFTFVDGGLSSLSYETSGQVSSSDRLYLFATGSQLMTEVYSTSTCLNFYERSIANASLTARKRDLLILGPFAGSFPTILVFANDFSCNRTVPLSTHTSRIIITLLNPNSQSLSGTLIGLKSHVAGLFSVYAGAVLYALYCLWSSKRCDRCHRVDAFAFGSELRIDTSAMIDDASKNSSDQLCCSCASAQLSRTPYFPSYSRQRVSLNNQEKRLYYMLTLLCLQCFASLLAWLEFSRFSNSTLPATRPVFGTDGIRSQFAEWLSVFSHYMFMGLLMSQATADSSGLTEHHNFRRTAVSKSGSSMPVLSSFSGHRTSLPVLSVFRLGRAFSLNRLTWLLLFAQLTCYGSLHYSNSNVAYAGPEMWPAEEQHGFWAGLGIPNTNYLPLKSPSSSTSHIRPSSPTGFFARMHTMVIVLTGSTSFLAVFLSSLRTIFGLVLVGRLAQISRNHRFGEMRSFYARFGWLGTAWFAAHPLLLLAGALFADHLRYKVVLVGVTLIQVTVVISLLVLFTRQTLRWDISALSTSLPLLRRIPSPGSE